MWYGVFTGRNSEKKNIPYLNFFIVNESAEATKEDVIRRFEEKEDMRTGVKIQYIHPITDETVRDIASSCCFNKEEPVSFAFFGSVKDVFAKSHLNLHVSMNVFADQIYASGPITYSRIQQGNYYSVLYDGEKKETIIETLQELNPDKRYSLNGKLFTVKSKKTYKYTLEDIDEIRVLTEGYETGTGKEICEHMLQAWERKIPNVHFSKEEKEFLSYIYHENEYISETDRSVLEKVLDIEPVNKLNLRRKGR